MKRIMIILILCLLPGFVCFSADRFSGQISFSGFYGNYPSRPYLTASQGADIREEHGLCYIYRPEAVKDILMMAEFESDIRIFSSFGISTEGSIKVDEDFMESEIAYGIGPFIDLFIVDREEIEIFFRLDYNWHREFTRVPSYYGVGWEYQAAGICFIVDTSDLLCRLGFDYYIDSNMPTLRAYTGILGYQNPFGDYPEYQPIKYSIDLGLEVALVDLEKFQLRLLFVDMVYNLSDLDGVQMSFDGYMGGLRFIFATQNNEQFFIELKPHFYADVVAFDFPIQEAIGYKAVVMEVGYKF